MCLMNFCRLERLGKRKLADRCPKMRKCLNLETFWSQKPGVFEPGPPKVRNCLNFGALEGETPRVVEPGPPKVRNCLNFGARRKTLSF